MKFDHVNPGHEGEAPPPDARFPEEGQDPTAEPSVPLHVLRLQQSSEYMRLRARTDFARVRPALNRLLHTVEATRAEGVRAEVSPGPEPGAADETDVFRPENFRPRTRTRPRDQ
ncbi:hypothetical protein ACFWTE_06190 [Nocardiopsis sp. NPDC058631]|uniref:hypothetical protein n=1 Tax=Nocardiopsis sp. NPDC058631 TaxID=3346566 RepID=UPI00365D367B